MTTQKPMQGVWSLIAPDGREWRENSPLRCVSLEQQERIPADVALEQILRSAQPDKQTPDCRTCAMFKNAGTHPFCAVPFDDPQCTNGDKYQPAPAVVLWRT